MFCWRLRSCILFLRKIKPGPGPRRLKCRRCGRGPRCSRRALLSVRRADGLPGLALGTGEADGRAGLFHRSLLLTVCLVPVQFSSQTLSPLRRGARAWCVAGNHRRALSIRRCRSHARPHREGGLPAGSGFVTNSSNSSKAIFWFS